MFVKNLFTIHTNLS